MEAGEWIALAGLLFVVLAQITWVYYTTKANKEGLDELRKDNVSIAGAFREIQREQIKMIEALERTYATEKFVYDVFITRKEHEQNLTHLEEKLVGEMRHMNASLDKICKYVEAGGKLIPPVYAKGDKDA